MTSPCSKALFTVAAAAVVACSSTAALAQRIENKVAVFAALDKVTARISKLEATLGETVKFGSLKLTPRVCYSRSATEQPKTTTFVEVDETLLSGQEKRLFAGWMFADSPGLHAVEHPVFDLWLTECKQPVKAPPVAAVAKSGQSTVAGTGAPTALEEPLEPRRRVRR